MAKESRVKKTLLNMRINMITYFVAIVISFFTRKIFLDQLGPEFMGLTTTVNGLLGFLNLAELGVGASIAYFLYKPLYEDDHDRINETISIMGYLYRLIGSFILTIGVLFSLFLPLVFKATSFTWGIIYLVFYGQLFCSMLGYFLNYKANTIFAADQRQYLVNSYFQLTQFLSMILQAILAYYTRSFTLYIVVMVAFAIINSLILNRKFNKCYPWVEASISRGKEALKFRPEILRYVKRVFIHQIGRYVNNSAMPVIVYGYASLTMVTLYSNYTLLNNKISNLIYSALGGTEASVGNLIAEGDKQKIFDCYKELYSIKFFVVAFLSICLVFLNSDFIAVWLGKEYVLPSILVILICADFFLNLARNTTDQFINGFGLKADIWVPICRVISLAIIIGAGLLWGLTGILAVPVVVQITLMHIWKPYYLFHSGLQIPFGRYWRLLLVNVLPFIIASVLSVFVSKRLGFCEELADTWTFFLLKTLSFCLPLLCFSLLLAWYMSEGIRMFGHRLAERIKA